MRHNTPRLVLLSCTLGALLAVARNGTAQELGWPHWKTGDKIAGDEYSYRVVRADTAGDGWEEIEVSGTGFTVLREDDGEPVTPARVTDVKASRLYLIRGATGIESAFAARKIPRWARDALLAEEKVRFFNCQQSSPTQSLPCQDLYVVSRAALARIPIRPLTPEPQPVTAAPIDLTTAPFFLSCSDYDKKLQFAPSYHEVREPPPEPFSGDFDGTISHRLTIDVESDGIGVVLRVKKDFCIPWMVYLKSASFHLDASADAEVRVAGTFDATTGEQHLRKELAAPKLGTLRFSIGPVPVVIPIDLPIGVGLDYEVEAAGNLDVTLGATAGFVRSYKCDPGCSSDGSGGSLTFFGESATTLERARVKLFGYADVGVRASLYHHKVAQITVGVRPGVEADAFYRAPALGCGDADGVEGDEVVEGRLIDLDGRVDLFAAASVWKLADGTWPTTLGETHLQLADFGVAPGSVSVITPMFSAPEVFSPGDTLHFEAKMRPCWPWGDGVEYDFSIDNDPTLKITASSKKALTAATLDQEVTAPGIRNNSVEPRNDLHERDLAGHPTHRSARGNLAPLGFIDFAVNAVDGSAKVPLGGKIAAGGWALDRDSSPAAPVAGVELEDGISGDLLAELLPGSGLGGERPDVVAVFDRADARWSGWSTRFTVRGPAPGRLSLFATARDAEGGAVLLANNPQLEVVLNDTTATPGEIDESDDNVPYRGNTRPRTTTAGTIGYRDDYGASCGAGARSEDAVYRLRLSSPRRVMLSTAGSEYDTVLHVKRQSVPLPAPGRDRIIVPPTGPIEVACNDDANGTLQSELLLDLPAGTYYVIVDGYDTLNRGPFELTVSFP